MSDSFSRDLVNQLRGLGAVDPRDAEIERLTKLVSDSGNKRHRSCCELLARAEKAEAERDEARAQVAAAFEAAAQRCDNHARHEVGREAAMLRSHATYFRALTPADAKAALEAYGREKVQEGMRMAAEIIRGCCPECLGTGVRDSGGVHPWGEPISVPCDCTSHPAPVTAQEAAPDFATSRAEAMEPKRNGEPKPTGWFEFDENTGEFTGEWCSLEPAYSKGFRPLYAHPPQPSEAVAEALTAAKAILAAVGAYSGGMDYSRIVTAVGHIDAALRALKGCEA